MKKLVILIIFLLVIPFIYAKEYHLPLLAVKETEQGFKGSTADLYLEIKDGRGRVFLDTYPLTKLDTQMSTRFAKEIACSKTGFDCNKYDFIYTIKSSSVIVGGPSAGAAISLLTIAALEDLELKKDIALTGTINSGGLIGPVGGLKEKLDAASSIGIKTVLVPPGEISADISINYTDNTSNRSEINESIDLIEYGKKLGINVIEVFTISQSLYYMTGKEIEETNLTLDIDPTYIETMKSVTEELCEKTTELKENISNSNIRWDEYDQSIIEFANNLTKRYEKALENKRYYSAASYCFGANTKFTYLALKLINLSKKEIFSKITEVKVDIEDFNKELDKKEIKTITDLETYMVVKERLIEAEESINKVIDIKNDTEKIQEMGYAIERLDSARSWSNFFGKGQKEFSINKDKVKESCVNKIYEAEERYEYLRLITSMEFETTENSINLAKKDLENQSYELCLFKASKAKAESDVILNTIGINESQLLEVTNKRLDIIKKNIIEEQQNGIFPVVGYSYYEYADDLKDKDIYSSMLFTEYSLELSNLDIYFEKQEPKFNFSIKINKEQVIGLILVFSAGLLMGILIGKSKKHKRKK